MATRGWEGVKPASTRAKYHNVRVQIDGRSFASLREAKYWQGLKAREAAGEISGLRCQVEFPLLAPTGEPGVNVQVSRYVADFVYQERGEEHVIDAKGHKTPVYTLKAKWLWFQSGIVIEEV
jgi:hypothetical protein